MKNLKFRPFFTRFFGVQAHNRKMGTNNTKNSESLRTSIVGLYKDYIINYKSAKFHCSSSFAFELAGGGLKNTVVL